MGFVGNYGSANGSKMSAMVYGSYNDSDGLWVPVYIGQKSTLQDNWGISLDADRVSNFRFGYGGGSTEATVSRFTKMRSDAAYSNLDKGIVEYCVQGNTGAPAAHVRFRWSYEVATNNIGKCMIDVTTGATPGTSFKSVFHNDTVQVVVNGDLFFNAYMYGKNNTTYFVATTDEVNMFSSAASFIRSKKGAATIIQADTGGANDIQLTTSATGKVDFVGNAVTSTVPALYGYLPIKIGGVAYKMALFA
jgi:hypothetical protein